MGEGVEPTPPAGPLWAQCEDQALPTRSLALPVGCASVNCLFPYWLCQQEAFFSLSSLCSGSWKVTFTAKAQHFTASSLPQVLPCGASSHLLVSLLFMAAGMEAMLKWAGQPAAHHLASPLGAGLSGSWAVDLFVPENSFWSQLLWRSRNASTSGRPRCPCACWGWGRAMSKSF